MAKTYEELLDAVLEAVCFGTDAEENLIEEGANTQLRGIKRQAKDLKKVDIKQMKVMYKSGNYAVAKKAGEEILAVIEDYEKQFKDVDQSFGNVVLGNLMGNALRLIKNLALGLITLGIGPTIDASKRLCSRSVQMLKSSGDKDVDYKIFNAYANDILTMLDDMKHQVKKVMSKCDEELKAAGDTTQKSADAKPTNESVDENLDGKLAIYESAYAGEITDEERDGLLELLERY